MTALALLGQQAAECRSCQRILFTDRFGMMPRHYIDRRPNDKIWCIRGDQMAERAELL